jgi:hypothetical protein
MIQPAIDHWTMYDSLIEDLERLKLKLGLEAALQEKGSELAKTLQHMALEAEDALYKLRRLADQKPGDL